MRTIPRIVTTISEAAIVMCFTLIGTTCASAVFAWLLFRATTDSSGVSFMNWYMAMACAPILYFTWLVWVLTWMSVEYRLHCFLLNYKKPSRISSSEGFRGYFTVGIMLVDYSRERFLRSLPLVELFISLPGLRQLVFRTYADSVHIGFNALILGRVFDPDLTEIGEGSIIGSGASIVAHNLIVDANGSRVFVTSPIKIGPRAIIGGGAQINMGVEIGFDAIVEPESWVVTYTKIGNGEVWGGIPARYLRMRNQVSDTPLKKDDSPIALRLDTQTELCLTSIVARALNRPQETIAPDMTHLDSGSWDSLAQLQMSLGLKEHFDIELRNQESFQLRSMDNLRAIIKAHRCLPTQRIGA